MQTSKRSLLALAVLAAAGVRAHEGQTHRKGAPRKEQKPWGIAGDTRAVRRTIRVRMHDTMRFEPEAIGVALGETVRFRIANAGRVMHEFVIGTKAENALHAEQMKKFPDMEHDEPYMAHVAPGKSGEIVWHFNRAGEFEFACLIAGHYDAGMAGTITVRKESA